MSGIPIGDGWFPCLRGPREIKHQVAAILRARAADLRGKVVVDCPAGSGHGSNILKEIGADVRPFDLFPEFFRADGLECGYGDLAQALPLADACADFILFQEAIEHLADQLHALRELNRILKCGGSVLLTTPNYSNLRSRLSYLWNESEYYKYMPPNEIESIWMAPNDRSQIYYGHIFNLGAQKLRLLAVLSGFAVARIFPARASTSAVVSLPFLMPGILAVNLAARRRALRRNRERGERVAEVFGDQLRLGLHPHVLTAGHLIVELKKVRQPHEVSAGLTSRLASFAVDT